MLTIVSFQRRCFTAAFFSLLALGVPGSALATYTFTPVVVPGSSSNFCVNGLNDNGQIVIGSDLGTYVYQDGTFTPLPPPPPPYSSYALAGTGINNAGVVVGAAFPPGGTPEQGFIFDGSAYTFFSRPGYVDTEPRGIGPSGLVTGVSYDSTGQSDGFLYDPSTGAFTDVTPPGSISTVIQGINAAGQIAGSGRNSFSLPVYGFIYQDGTFSTFEILDGRTRPRGINDLALSRVSLFR